jgi:hypothetical protein
MAPTATNVRALRMDSLATAAAAFLSGVFVLAALAKTRSATATTRSFLTLNIPGLTSVAQANRLRIAVLVSEVLTATALLVRPRIGSIVGLVLLASFTGILRRATSGSRSSNGSPELGSGAVRCGCFGALGDDRVTTTTFVRNAFLLLTAFVGLFADRPLWRLPAVLVVMAGFLLCALTLQFVELSNNGPLLPSVGSGHDQHSEVIA